MLKTLKCNPQLFQKDLSGRVYIVTGANSGSGFATTEQLAKQGAHVVAACRRVQVAQEVFSGLEYLPGKIEVMELDLSRLASVRQFTAAFLDSHERLDGLVNNAGIMATAEGKTEDGFEKQFGTNHLGHFLLTEGLLDILKSSAPSRIVCLSSVAHAGVQGKEAKIDFEDTHFEKRPYDPLEAYCQSKLANVLHASNLAQRLEGTGVTAYSVHPGWIRSNLAGGVGSAGPLIKFMQNVLLRPFSRFLGTMSWFEGAQTTLHCLLDDQVLQHNGQYFSQNSLFYVEKKDRPGGWPMVSPNPLAKDAELAEKLYQKSLEWVKGA